MADDASKKRKLEEKDSADDSTSSPPTKLVKPTDTNVEDNKKGEGGDGAGGAPPSDPTPQGQEPPSQSKETPEEPLFTSSDPSTTVPTTSPTTAHAEDESAPAPVAALDPAPTIEESNSVPNPTPTITEEPATPAVESNGVPTAPVSDTSDVPHASKAEHKEAAQNVTEPEASAPVAPTVEPTPTPTPAPITTTTHMPQPVTTTQSPTNPLPSTLPPGVPLPTSNAQLPAPTLNTHTQTHHTTHTHQTSQHPNSHAELTIEEKSEVSTHFVGRVIGKGGEMIRDLQARSNCRIDVDQNVPPGAPRIVTYRGTAKTVAFAKRLVEMLCTRDGKEADLPLGEATRRDLIVPANVIGKIIGRGGEMIRELQSKSQAKIQVDHTAHNSGGPLSDATVRKVTLTGTELSVRKAEEMILFLIANPALDANVAIGMLMKEKASGASEWGSGPPYAGMINGGQGIGEESVGGGHGGAYHGGGSYGQSHMGAYGQPQGHAAYGGGGGGGGGMYGSSESEIFPCAKMYMGRIIGQKGVTINDLQKRSMCDIQINQDVPHGCDCEITIKGSRQGIDTAKQMLTEIIQMGPNHPYAGGGNGGGTQYGGNGMVTGGGAGYGRQGGGYQPQSAYGGQQYGQPQDTGGYQPSQSYGQQSQPHHQQQYSGGYQPSQSYGQQSQPHHQHQYTGGYQPSQLYGQQSQQQPHSQATTHQAQAQAQAQAYPPQYYGGAVAHTAPGVPGGMVGAPVIQTLWKAATAPDGQTYYYNEKSGESSWEKPPGM